MRRVVVVLTVALSVLGWPTVAEAANCGRTSTGMVALPDLAGGTYKGERGGLYLGGTNEPPTAYSEAGLRAAGGIVARAPSGAPDPKGKAVLLSVGMSNTTQEFSAFVGLARGDAMRAAHVEVVDGAQGGQDASRWTSASALTWSTVDSRLLQAGVSAAQVQAIWLKQAIAEPRGDFQTEARRLWDTLRAIVDVATQRFPNLQQVFVSPRTYAGYATTTLNPEPYAYESAFADRLLIADSIARPEARPWIGWGPYLWTDGTRGRGDGFVWTCDDAAQDGTHPSASGRRKVAEQLQRFFDESRFASWYRGGAPSVAAAMQSPIAPSIPESLPEMDAPTPVYPMLLAGLGVVAVLALWWLRHRSTGGN